jgi:hypothetical protein
MIPSWSAQLPRKLENEELGAFDGHQAALAADFKHAASGD